MYIYTIHYFLLSLPYISGNRDMNGKDEADQVSRYEFINFVTDCLKAILSHGPDILSERIHFFQSYILIHFSM